jgi:hypothetical protein
MNTGITSLLKEISSGSTKEGVSSKDSELANALKNKSERINKEKVLMST